MKKSESKFITKMREAGFSQEAIDKFIEYYVSDPGQQILALDTFRDPYVYGTIALKARIVRVHEYKWRKQVKRKKYFMTLELLWYSGDFDEVEFTTWPPTARANNLQFFI